jgi:hypothetical protein
MRKQLPEASRTELCRLLATNIRAENLMCRCFDTWVGKIEEGGVGQGVMECFVVGTGFFVVTSESIA